MTDGVDDHLAPSLRRRSQRDKARHESDGSKDRSCACQCLDRATEDRSSSEDGPERDAHLAANGPQGSRELRRDRRMRGECTEASQTVLGPGASHLIVARKLPAYRCRLRGGDRVAFGGRKANRRFLIDPSQAQHRPGNPILLIGWQIANDRQRIIQKLCHRLLHSMRPRAPRHTLRNPSATIHTTLNGLIDVQATGPAHRQCGALHRPLGRN